MYSVIANGDNTQSSVVELIADDSNDINTLPTDFGPGSTCIVSKESTVFILGNDKKWHEL